MNRCTEMSIFDFQAARGDEAASAGGGGGCGSGGCGGVGHQTRSLPLLLPDQGQAGPGRPFPQVRGHTGTAKKDPTQLHPPFRTSLYTACHKLYNTMKKPVFVKTSYFGLLTRSFTLL